MRFLLLGKLFTGESFNIRSIKMNPRKRRILKEKARHARENILSTVVSTPEPVVEMPTPVVSVVSTATETTTKTTKKRTRRTTTKRTKKKD